MASYNRLPTEEEAKEFARPYDLLEDSRAFAEWEHCLTLAEQEFTVGQSYDDHPAVTIRCKKCQSRNFYVGVGSHYAAIKCQGCGWEDCIHRG